MYANFNKPSLGKLGIGAWIRIEKTKILQKEVWERGRGVVLISPHK